MTNDEAAATVYARFVNPAGDHTAVYDVLHDDVTFECPFYDDFVVKAGKAEVEAMMRRVDEGAGAFFASQAFPFHALHATDDPTRFIIEAQGDHVIRDTGKAYRNHYFHCLEIEDGKVRRWVEYSNPNEFERATTA